MLKVIVTFAVFGILTVVLLCSPNALITFFCIGFGIGYLASFMFFSIKDSPSSYVTAVEDKKVWWEKGDDPPWHHEDYDFHQKE